MSGRERGVLSQADRAYLRGETEFASAQSERNARSRIRDRIHDAVLDFEVLIEHLPDHDREIVFEKRFGRMEGTEAFDALVSAVAFLYQAIDDTEVAFETVLKEAINLAEAKDDRAATVDLDLTFQTLSAEQLQHKLEQGESLSLTEIAYLHQSDEVGPDELAAYFATAEAATEEIDDGRIQSKVTNF